MLPGKGSDPLIQIKESKEYGASKFIISVARQLGLDRIIHSRKVQWREDLLAMIVERLLHPDELSFANSYADTLLWEFCGHPLNKKPDIDKHCYYPLEKLLSKQDSIQEKLVDKHWEKGCAVLYDLTSGDLRFGPEKLHIGLLCNLEGCPLGVEFFEGVTEEVIQPQIEALVDRFKFKSITLVGNWQMLSKDFSPKVNAKEVRQKWFQVEDEFENVLFAQSGNRGRASVLLHMLSYYLKWHISEKLKSIFNNQKKGRQWTFRTVIERLKSIRSQTIQIDHTVLHSIKSTLDAEQHQILSAFDINL